MISLKANPYFFKGKIKDLIKDIQREMEERKTNKFYKNVDKIKII